MASACAVTSAVWLVARWAESTAELMAARMVVVLGGMLVQYSVVSSADKKVAQMVILWVGLTADECSVEYSAESTVVQWVDSMAALKAGSWAE